MIRHKSRFPDLNRGKFGAANVNLYAVIMAGGRGERFWPMGRKNTPKQLLALNGEQTMIEETVLRLFPLLSPDRILVVTNQDYQDRIRELLPIPPENVIGEPSSRNTAPCIALAAGLIARRDPDATMILLPADHVIRPAKALQKILSEAALHAQSGALVTLGIPPNCPSTGYGYIHCGEVVDQRFSKVVEFHEKPDAKTAGEYLRKGYYKWNSGIFIWKIAAIRDAFAAHCPELAVFMDGVTNAPDAEMYYKRKFTDCPRISIDYAVMEKARNVLVGETDFYWNDIGSWSSLRSLYEPDSAGNIVRGHTLLLDTANCVVIGDDSALIGVIGMNDVAVIKSGNGMLVCPLREEQRIRELIRMAEEKNLTQFI